jgi:hypothetical protein
LGHERYIHRGFIVLVTTVIALLAAALFGVSTALQHRSAGLVSEAHQGSDRVSAFIARVLRHPLWIIGAIADIGGFVLHALALSLGPLTVVQPLLVSSIVFSVVLRELLERRWPRRSELVWATALTIGLVMFLTISAPSGRLPQPADPVPAAVVGVLIMVGMTLLARGVGALATSWALYALVAVGAFSIVVNQLAYRAGPLSSSLPTIMTVDALVSLLIGASVFDEGFHNGAVDLLGEAVGLALMLVAAVGLSRSGPGPASVREQRTATVARRAPLQVLAQ